MDKFHEELTDEELGVLGIKRVLIEDIALERPVGAPEGYLNRVRLSPYTIRQVERREALRARKKRARKKYTRKPGHVHPKRKQATARRRHRRRWEVNPYWCVIKGWGRWDIPRQTWDKIIAPLWGLYDPHDLSVKRYRHAGTTTVLDLDIVHKELGVVYSGRSQQLYELSGGEGPHYM